jgi:hypothetical protein
MRSFGTLPHEQASFLALNRMHGIVTGAKSVQARDYYGNEF